MIRYDLRCASGHEFTAWFRSSAAFDEQRGSEQVLCAICGSAEVKKALMAPAVKADRSASDLSKPASPAEAMLAELRREIEKRSEYVGDRFAAEARRIHLGEAEQRPIWGEASREEASALGEEGVPVVPIPWMRRRDG